MADREGGQEGEDNESSRRRQDRCERRNRKRKAREEDEENRLLQGRLAEVKEELDRYLASLGNSQETENSPGIPDAIEEAMQRGERAVNQVAVLLEREEEFIKIQKFEKFDVRFSTVDIKKVPKQFLCPIMMDIMREPVVAADGHTYEELAISRWLRRNRNSPMTGATLDSDTLTPNHTLRSMIQEYIDSQ